MPRTFILISVDAGFEQKFINFIHNLNVLNNNKETVLKIEEVFKEPEYAAIPIRNNKEN